MKLRPGQLAPYFSMRDLYGRNISLEAFRGDMVFVSFNRAAVCPLCNVRTYHLIQRYPIYQQMGLSIIAFFESSPQSAHDYLDRLQAPFPIIPDLRHEIYDAYGLGASFLGGLRALVMRRAVYREAERLRLGAGTHLIENLRKMDGNLSRLPGDFLIGPDGRIRAAYYGRDAGDFMLFRELEAAAFGAPLDAQMVARFTAARQAPRAQR